MTFHNESLGVAKERGGSQRKALKGKRDRASEALTSGTGDEGGPGDHAACLTQGQAAVKLDQLLREAVLPGDGSGEIKGFDLARAHDLAALNDQIAHAGGAAEDQAGDRIP